MERPVGEGGGCNLLKEQKIFQIFEKRGVFELRKNLQGGRNAKKNQWGRIQLACMYLLKEYLFYVVVVTNNKVVK